MVASNGLLDVTLAIICLQGHRSNTHGMRPHLPHPAAQLGGTRPPNQPDPQQSPSGAGGVPSGVGGVAQNGPGGSFLGPRPRPAGPLGAKAGLGGFRPPFGAGPRPSGQPPSAPPSVANQQPAAPVPLVNRGMGAPVSRPNQTGILPQQPLMPGQPRGLQPQQQQPALQRQPAALGPPRLDQPAAGWTGPPGVSLAANGGVPQQSGAAAHRPLVSSPSAASAQRQPPPPPFGVPAAQQGPVPGLGPSSACCHGATSLQLLRLPAFALLKRLLYRSSHDMGLTTAQRKGATAGPSPTAQQRPPQHARPSGSFANGSAPAASGARIDPAQIPRPRASVAAEPGEDADSGEPMVFETRQAGKHALPPPTSSRYMCVLTLLVLPTCYKALIFECISVRSIARII